MWRVSRFAQCPNPITEQDVQLLIRIIATVEGDLLARNADPHTTEKYAKRFVDVGLLSRDSDGHLPSAGKVVLALEDLIQRLRYVLGEYDEAPLPMPELLAHELELPSEEAARSCLDALPSGQVRDAVIHHTDTEGWLLLAFYPELPPDRDFHERAALLERTAALHGGRYNGSHR
jgi:hypothetical protein